MTQNRDEYFAHAKVMLAQQDERVQALKARIDDFGGVDQAELAQALVEILESKINAMCALNDLQLVSQPGWHNATVAAEAVWQSLDQALSRLEQRLN